MVVVIVYFDSYVSAQAVPLTLNYDGYVYPVGNSGGCAAVKPIKLEAFYDLMCPDCRAVHPTVKKVAVKYQEKLSFTMHLFPLPYHNNAYTMSVAAHVIAKHNETKVWDWVEAVFRAQNDFGNKATERLTKVQINDRIATLGESIGISNSILMKGLDNPNMDYSSRISWKFGCSKTVSGTPTFALNSIILPPDSAEWTLHKWSKLIDDLLSQQDHTDTLTQLEAS